MNEYCHSSAKVADLLEKFHYNETPPTLTTLREEHVIAKRMLSDPCVQGEMNGIYRIYPQYVIFSALLQCLLEMKVSANEHENDDK